MRLFRTLSMPVALLALGSTCAFAQYKQQPLTELSPEDAAKRLPAQLVGVGIEEHLGRSIEVRIACIALSS